MRTKIKYENIIHSDDTIARTKIFYFKNIDVLSSFWKNRKSIDNDGGWTADIKNLTIEVKDWVKSEVYFAHIDGDEEE